MTDRRTLAIVLGISAFAMFFIACVLGSWFFNRYVTLSGSVDLPTEADIAPPPQPTIQPTVIATDTTPDEVAPTSVIPTEENTSSPDEPQPIPTGNDNGFACVTFGPTNIDLPSLMCLNSAGDWAAYTEENSPIRIWNAGTMHVCPDGAVWVDGSGFGIFDGQTWQEIEIIGGDGLVFRAFACTDEEIWGLHTKGLDYFDGTDWTSYTLEEIAPDVEDHLAKDMAISSDGTVWVVLSKTIHRFDGQTWTQYSHDDVQHSSGAGWTEQLLFSTIAIDQTGNPWVSYNRGLLTFDGQNWTVHEPDEFPDFLHIAIDSQDRKWVASRNGVFQFDGQNWTTFTRENSELSSNAVTSITFDSADRAWISTRWGLNILDGTQWSSYHMNTSDLASNDIALVAVSGNGPSLPAPVSKPTGTLRGTLRVAEEALADTPVEICVTSFNASSDFEDTTPCSEQALFYQTTTDAEGQFQFTDVLAGHYVVAIKSGNSWTSLYRSSGVLTRFSVDPEQETDLGEWVVDGEQ